MSGGSHVLLYIDAMDKKKGALPTCKSEAKCLGGLHKIVQKITGVQIIGDTGGLRLFRSLPDVKTGGNLTATILACLFAEGECRVGMWCGVWL